MMEYFLIQVVPKVPGGLLHLFLKGVSCTDVMLVTKNELESWIDFKFMGERFEAHRDCEEWRFFVDKGSSVESASASALVKRIRAVGNSWHAWGAVCKGFFV